MRLLICKECRRTFQTIQKTYTPKYCAKQCYWKALKTPETINYERYKIVEENLRFLISRIFPILAIFLSCVAIATYFAKK